LNPSQVEGAANGMVDVRVGNPGTTPVTVRLDAEAQGSPLSFTFSPPMLSIGAQAEAHSRLQVQSSAVVAPGERRPYDFRIAATATDGAALPAAANGRFTQVVNKQPFPWIPIIILALLALIVLCGVVLLMISQTNLFR
jgi:hypothetical protein